MSNDTLIGYPRYEKQLNASKFWEVIRILNAEGDHNYICECADEQIAIKLCSDWNNQRCEIRLKEEASE